MHAFCAIINDISNPFAEHRNHEMQLHYSFIFLSSFGFVGAGFCFLLFLELPEDVSLFSFLQRQNICEFRTFSASFFHVSNSYESFSPFLPFPCDFFSHIVTLFIYLFLFCFSYFFFVLRRGAVFEGIHCVFYLLQRFVEFSLAIFVVV